MLGLLMVPAAKTYCTLAASLILYDRCFLLEKVLDNMISSFIIIVYLNCGLGLVNGEWGVFFPFLPI